MKITRTNLTPTFLAYKVEIAVETLEDHRNLLALAEANLRVPYVISKQLFDVVPLDYTVAHGVESWVSDFLLKLGCEIRAIEE